MVKTDNKFGNSLNACGEKESINPTKTYQLGNAQLKFPGNWRVRPAEKLKGLEAADTSAFAKSLRILTFSIHEFQSDGSRLADYFESEVELMKQDTMKLGIIEQGTRDIDHKNSFYVITSDTIQGTVLHQLFFYTESRDKSYTIQIGSSDMKDPSIEFCEYLWLIDSIDLL
jgi:hypothetical protein